MEKPYIPTTEGLEQVNMRHVCLQKWFNSMINQQNGCPIPLYQWNNRFTTDSFRSLPLSISSKSRVDTSVCANTTLLQECIMFIYTAVVKCVVSKWKYLQDMQGREYQYGGFKDTTPYRCAEHTHITSVCSFSSLQTQPDLKIKINQYHNL